MRVPGTSPSCIYRIYHLYCFYCFYIASIALLSNLVNLGARAKPSSLFLKKRQKKLSHFLSTSKLTKQPTSSRSHTPRLEYHRCVPPSKGPYYSSWKTHRPLRYNRVHCSVVTVKEKGRNTQTHTPSPQSHKPRNSSGHTRNNLQSRSQDTRTKDTGMTSFLGLHTHCYVLSLTVYNPRYR